MFCRGEPILHRLFEFRRGHPGMGGHDNLGEGFLTALQDTFHIAFEQGGERFLILPFGMLGRERLHAVEREQKLEIHRLLGPERAVVIERGDALGDRHEVGRMLFRHFGDKRHDSLLGRPFPPRGERVGSASGHRGEGEHAGSHADEDLFAATWSHGFLCSISLRATPWRAVIDRVYRASLG